MSAGRWFNGVLVGLVLASVATADEVRRWRDAQGRVHVEIVGAGGPASPAPAGGARDDAARFSTEVSLRRREIERGLVAATERLAAKREEIRRVEQSRYLVQMLPTPKSEDEQQRARDLARTAVLAANAFEDQKRRRLFFLRREEREILFEIADLWQDLDRLRDEVLAYYGEKPDWWIDRMRCGACPSLAEVEKALETNEVEVVTTADPTPTATR